MLKNLILDFDSTVTQLEGLDMLAEVAGVSADKLAEIKSVTNQGMAGEISFAESLRQRIQLLEAGRGDLDLLVERLHNLITPSLQSYLAVLKQYRDHIYVVSGGFKEFVVPVVTEIGLLPEHVFANEFKYAENGIIIDRDVDNLAAQGKVEIVRSLELDPEMTVVVGDGYSDYEIKLAGLAGTFIAFTENIHRPSVRSVADLEATDFMEVFTHLNYI